MNRYMQEKWPWIEGTHALLIFLGKATVFFSAMNKAYPQPIQEYIG